MIKREQILRECIRKMKHLDFVDINQLNEGDTFEIERFVFSGTKAYIQVNLLDRILCAVIPDDQLAFILHEIEMIDDYDLTSFDVYFREWSDTQEEYKLKWASLEDFFNALNTDIVKEILFCYAEDYAIL